MTRRTKTVRKKSSKRAPPVSAEQLRMALEAAGMVTWEWDLRRDVIRYSDNVPDIAAGDAVEPYCSASGLIETVHPDDREAVRRAVARTMEEGLPYECEYRVKLLDGVYHWILGKGKSVRFERGRPVSVLGISQDITARKRAEQKLQARSQQLARLAAELTMAEHRERRRLADLLHENLQQLLVLARVQTQSLFSREKRKKSKDEFARLQRALDDALTVSRSVTKSLVPPLSLWGDLPSALQWLAEDMRERCNLVVSFRTPKTLAPLPEPVAVLLFTAARELLLNVAKHAGASGCRMSLRQEGVAVELKIRDKGKGFNVIGFRKSGSDTGFGLFSIRERAELLGGRLLVHAAPGRGTDIAVTLPLRS